MNPLHHDETTARMLEYRSQNTPLLKEIWQRPNSMHIQCVSTLPGGQSDPCQPLLKRENGQCHLPIARRDTVGFPLLLLSGVLDFTPFAARDRHLRHIRGCTSSPRYGGLYPFSTLTDLQCFGYRQPPRALGFNMCRSPPGVRPPYEGQCSRGIGSSLHRG